MNKGILSDKQKAMRSEYNQEIARLRYEFELYKKKSDKQRLITSVVVLAASALFAICSVVYTNSIDVQLTDRTDVFTYELNRRMLSVEDELYQTIDRLDGLRSELTR